MLTPPRVSSVESGDMSPTVPTDLKKHHRGREAESKYIRSVVAPTTGPVDLWRRIPKTRGCPRVSQPTGSSDRCG